eukprot:106088_1
MTSCKPHSPNKVTCNHEFQQCPDAQRLKLILERYNKIILDKTHKSNEQLQNETTNLIANLLVEEPYSVVKLLNNFYHIKYVHNVNNDPSQFNLFYDYLFDNQTNVLKCDIDNCKSAKRYSHRRNRSFYYSQLNAHENVEN